MTADVDRLIGIATRLGIDVATPGSLHRWVFDRTARDAWADGTLTRTGLLETDHGTVIASQLGTGGNALNGSVPVGSEVVLTGEMTRPRSELEAILVRCGYVAAASVTKRTRLLIAADPHSQSGKAQRARRYGIPVLGLSDGFAVLGIDG